MPPALPLTIKPSPLCPYRSAVPRVLPRTCSVSLLLLLLCVSLKSVVVQVVEGDNGDSKALLRRVIDRLLLVLSAVMMAIVSYCLTDRGGI